MLTRNRRIAQWAAGTGLIAAGSLAALGPSSASAAGLSAPIQAAGHPEQSTPTATPIKHLIVVFQENVPFDHYFGTYPQAANPLGEPRFTPRPGTPTVNGLTPALLSHNPNSANPKRLDRTQPVVCGSNHDYLAEQKAFDHGLMDRFVEETGSRSRGCDQTEIRQ